MSASGFNDYLNSTSAPLILLGETALAATFILAVLVTIIVSSTVHRSAVSTNVYVSLLVFCLSYFVFPITGQWSTPEPSFGLCIASAMTVYASFPLIAASILTLSITLSLSVFQIYRPSNKTIIDTTLIVVPYVIWVGVMVLTFVIGNARRDEVIRHGYPYCFIARSTVRDTCHVLIVAFFLPCFILQGFMIYRLYWSRPFRKNPDLRDQMREPIIRMAIVCIGSICTLGVTLSLGRHWDRGTQLIFSGLFPLIAIIEIGTQREILRSWVRWTKRLFRFGEGRKRDRSHVQSLASDV